jgi:hypothetical protein
VDLSSTVRPHISEELAKLKHLCAQPEQAGWIDDGLHSS